jgi:S1-C subfamily serine protease
MKRLSAFIILEQVGRLSEDRLIVRGADSSKVWPKLIEASNVAVGFDINTEKFGPTDAVVFYKAGVPTLELSGGRGKQQSTLAQDDVERVAQLAHLLVRKLEQQAVHPELSSGVEEQREVQRAFTGTVPDYAADVEGLRLEGVVEGGPADLAGLQEGDVIIRFGEHTIENVYDYSDALADAKPGVPIEVVLLRDGTEYVASLTPTIRE